jgi:GNAT superfamily N-acetyltransferase
MKEERADGHPNSGDEPRLAASATATVGQGGAGPFRDVLGGVQWSRDGYAVSTDPDRLDIPATADFLASTPWARDISEPVVRRSIEGSIAFGLYDGADQIGFARVVTDRATFAWVGDVFVLESHRGLGLGRWLMECVLAHPDLQGLRRWMLASTTARGLYAGLGFSALPAPERFMEIADPGVHSRQRTRGEQAVNGQED